MNLSSVVTDDGSQSFCRALVSSEIKYDQLLSAYVDGYAQVILLLKSF